MTSHYLDRPLLPLAVALPRMLQEIEAALPIAGPAETRRLHKRAELIRDMAGPPDYWSGVSLSAHTAFL